MIQDRSLPSGGYRVKVRVTTPSVLSCLSSRRLLASIMVLEDVLSKGWRNGKALATPKQNAVKYRL